MVSLVPGGVGAASVGGGDEVAGPSRASGVFGLGGVLADSSDPPPHAASNAPAAVEAQSEETEACAVLRDA